MMLRIMASDEKSMPLYWFPKDLEIGTKEYQDVFMVVVLPWMKSN
uniref:Uncharacterized protein n=1 Tax=Lepeophtheirus salmonis TaxID=72036 RepID=A0A0K2TCJ2_LEPSM